LRDGPRSRLGNLLPGPGGVYRARFVGPTKHCRDQGSPARQRLPRSIALTRNASSQRAEPTLTGMKASGSVLVEGF
jgi:hypothetical protein